MTNLKELEELRATAKELYTLIVAANPNSKMTMEELYIIAKWHLESLYNMTATTDPHEEQMRRHLEIGE